LKKNWFEIWFDTAYHDLLYQHRDNTEAAVFIRNLISYFQLPPNATILDAACGKGRHAVLLAQEQAEVTGIDLSYRNIREAKKMEKDNLSFFQHDMSRPFRINYFDLILNFYTSFGYFDEVKKDVATIGAFATGLKKGGRLLIDFFNFEHVKDCLSEVITKVINDIEFTISKDEADGFIIKKIQVVDDGHTHLFYERVRALSIADFENYFHVNKLKINNVFGDYQLNPFDAQTSERLILIAEK